MKIAIEKGQLCLSLEELLDFLSPEDKLSLADFLACTDDVIKYVGQQIISGWTEHDSHGRTLSLETTHGTVLDLVTREVAEKSGEVASELIKKLRTKVDSQSARLFTLNEKNLQQSSAIKRQSCTIEELKATVEELKVVREELRNRIRILTQRGTE